MKTTLIEHLRCPITGQRLRLRGAGNDSESDEVMQGELYSESGSVYPIQDGVPILLGNEETEPGHKATVAAFSEKWRRAPAYRENTKAHYIQWYLERYGHQDLQALEQFLSTKRFILDAGTGEGRDVELYARHSKAMVIGVDISEGIHNAYQSLRHLPNAHFIRADLRRLPFRERFFDFIACDQAIHHTPDTYESFRALLRFLGAGHIAIYTYRKKGPIREFCDDFIRAKTVHYTPDECMRFSEAITKLGKALWEANVEIDIPEDIPILDLKAGKQNLQRWIYWNFFKCYWNENMDWTSNAVTNFDWYYPFYAHRHTPEEVLSWFREQGLTVEQISVVESGTSVLGKRGG